MEGCAFDESGDSVSCVTVPGVGAGLEWCLVAAGVAASGGSPAVYAAPVLTSVAPEFAATDFEGAGALVITGKEFGSAEANAVSSVVLRSGGGGARGAEEFPAARCAVNVSYDVIVCAPPLGGVRGGRLAILVSVGGQSTTQLSLSSARPLVTAVVMVNASHAAAAVAGCGAAAGSLCTRGGDSVRLIGDNFGPATAPAVDGAAGVVVRCECVRASRIRRVARDTHMVFP